jgi:hypothetical protein
MGALNDARGQVKAGCRMGKSGSLSATPLPYGTSGPFSVAIPLLAALVLVNQQEAFRHRLTKSVIVVTARVVAQTCAFVGLVAAFWHILWIAGVGMLASGIVGMFVHSAGVWRLERDGDSTSQETEESGD